MFHFDCTMEDVRIIAIEHRVPLDEEEMKDRQRHMESDSLHGAAVNHMPLDKHDGTFDVMHLDAFKGQTHTINLTTEELAAVIHLGMVGDDGTLSKLLYQSPEIKKYQELMKAHHEMSFIP